jgi:diphthine synthase
MIRDTYRLTVVFLCVGYEENTICVGLSRVGCHGENIVCTTLSKMKDTDIGAPLHSLVIPGKLHFLEIEMLKLFTDSEEILERLETMQKDTK